METSEKTVNRNNIFVWILLITIVIQSIAVLFLSFKGVKPEADEDPKIVVRMDMAESDIDQIYKMFCSKMIKWNELDPQTRRICQPHLQEELVGEAQQQPDPEPELKFIKPASQVEKLSDEETPFPLPQSNPVNPE